MTGGCSSARRNWARSCAAAGLRVVDIAGLTRDALTGGWRVSRDVGVNYLVMAR